MEKWKENRAYFWITSVIILIPMIVGILFWKQLPDRMATSFNGNNMPNGWSSKGFAVFGVPLFCFVVHVFCTMAILFDTKQWEPSIRIIRLVFLICPITSLICGLCIYGYALSYSINIKVLTEIFVGMIFVIIGNYLPKCRQNYVVGIKIPWTLLDKENWNHTHRLAGWIWVPCGVIFIFDAFFDFMSSWMFFVLLGIMAVLPIGYSFLYYLQHREL